MNIPWKTFLDNAKRIYDILFNIRDIEVIRSDYFSKKWISKNELIRLLDYEEKQFVIAYTQLQKEHVDMLSSFNMNSLSNYELLERKYQSQLKK
jgi:hypothetical protein